MQSCVYHVDAEGRRIHHPVRVDPYDIFLQVICAETAVQDDLPRRLRHVYAAKTIHSDSVAQILESIEAYLVGERAKESEAKHRARCLHTARGLDLMLQFLQKDDQEKIMRYTNIITAKVDELMAAPPYSVETLDSGWAYIANAHGENCLVLRWDEKLTDRDTAAAILDRWNIRE